MGAGGTKKAELAFPAIKWIGNKLETFVIGCDELFEFLLLLSFGVQSLSEQSLQV